MGVMTLTNFRDDLRSALGRSSEDATRIARWVNNSIREFAYAFEFPELEKTDDFDTVSGTPNYSLAADFRMLNGNGSVRIDTPQDRFGGIILPETRVEYLRTSRYPQTSSYGRPTKYHLYGKEMWLRATPDSTVMNIAYDYWGKITPLVDDADTSEFDEDWDDVIFRGALYRGYMAHGEHDRMINAFNMFLGLIRSRVQAQDLQEFPDGGISLIQSQFDDARR